MKPREIDVYIEELVLHGFEPVHRWRIADALQQELRGLLASKGVPSLWLSSPERINAGNIPTTSLAKPANAGTEIARAIQGGAR